MYIDKNYALNEHNAVYDNGIRQLFNTSTCFKYDVTYNLFLKCQHYIIRVKENSTSIIQYESIMCVANTNVLNVHNIYTLRQAPPVTHSMGDE